MSKQINTRLALRGSSLALATGLALGGASVAHAQAMIGPRIDPNVSVQANETVVSGSATVTRTANKDTVTVNTTSAIINWDTLDTNTIDVDPSFVNFLPAGTEMAFESALSDYTVLNRIFSTPNAAGVYRGIAFSGAVTSQVDVGSVGGIGGNIWFYAPGGILVGNGALFNVGSLMLTTSDVNAIGALGGSADFLGVTDPFSAIVIEPAASIVLPTEASYALLAAPTIDNAGIIDVNGSITLASIEAGSVVFGTDGSILDFTVTQQAQPGNGIVNTGLITGPASNQIQDVNGNVLTADPHVIEFLAPGAGVDSLISGAVGYQPALAAAQGDNGEILITATDGAGVALVGAQLNSDTDILASNVAMVANTGEIVGTTGDGRGGYDLSIEADNTLIGARPGGVVTVGGNLELSQNPSGTALLSILVEGDPLGALPSGVLDVGGDLVIDYSLDEFTSPVAPGNSPAPIAIDLVDGGVISVTGNFAIDTSVTAGDPGMATSDANGGDVSVVMTGTGNSITVGGTLSVDSSAKPFPFTTFDGNDATGGNVLLDFTGGTVAASSLAVNTSAESTFGSAASASGTPDATAGDISVLLGTGVDTIGSVLLDASARAAQGANSEAGGNAIGGNIVFSKSGANVLDTQNFIVDASATGGEGGSNFVFDANGLAGGIGIGGNITIDTVDMPALIQLAILATGTGGNASSGSDSGDGGTGGVGQGGSAILNVTANGAALGALADIGVLLGGFGGAGGTGGVPSSAPPGVGGTGGNGIGGAFALSINGVGGSLLVDPGVFPIDVVGIGGVGGDGGDDFSGFAGAEGGTGGDGSGGSIAFTAGSGATLQLGSASDPFSANGIGGNGGVGGDSFTAPAAGGAGGNGSGGQIGILAEGGTVTSGSLTLSANGLGGSGGLGGTDGSVGTAAQGNGGDGAGGTVNLATRDGSPGILQLGDVFLNANGIAGGGTIQGITAGGQITIIDGSVEANGLISMASLNANAFGDIAGTPIGFAMTGGSGPINVAGDMFVAVAGDAVYAFDADGQLVVGGFLSTVANGNVLVTHSNNATGLETIEVGAAATFNSGQDTIVDVGAIINGQDSVFMDARGNMSISEVRGVGNVTLRAAQNVDLGTAVVSGAPTIVSGVVTSGLFVEAGLLSTQPTDLFDPSGNATITGDVASSGIIQIRAGGSAVFAGGSQTAADNGVAVLTGDDIIVDAGAILSASGNPAFAPDLANPFGDANNLVLGAGALVPFLASTPNTPISSVVIDGTLNAHDFAIEIDANAIDGLDGSFVAGSLRADIANSPGANNPQSDDAGLLVAPCLEGTVCLGDLDLTGELAIGLSSVDGLVDAIVTGGTFSGTQIAIVAGRNIQLGTPGAGDSWTLSGALTLDANAGSIITGGLAITAGADSTLGAGIDILFDTIANTGGTLTLNSAGQIVGTTLSTLANAGTDDSISINAVDPILIDTVSSGDAVNVSGNSFFANLVQAGTTIDVVTAGTIAIGTAQSGSNTTLNGSDIALDDGAINGNLAATATASTITSTGQVNVLGTIDLAAPGSIALGTMIAGDAFTIQSDGDVSFAEVTTNLGVLDVTAAGNISGGTANNIAPAGSPAGQTVTLDAGGSVTLTGTNLATEDYIIRAGTGVTAGDISSVGLIDIASIAGPIVTGNLNSADVAISGAGSFTGGNIVQTGGSLDISTTGDVTFANATGSGDAAITTSGALVFDTLVSGGEVSLLALADLRATTISAGGDTAVDGFNVDVDTIETTTGQVFAIASGGEFRATTVRGPEDVFVTATGQATIDLVDAGQDAIIDGSLIDIETVTAARNIGVQTTASGGFDGRTLTAGNAVTVNAGTEGVDIARLNAAVANIQSAQTSQIDDSRVTGLLTIGGADITVGSNDSVRVLAIADPGSIDISAENELRVFEATAGSFVTLESRTGNIIVEVPGSTGDTVSALDGDATLTAAGDIDIRGSVFASQVAALAAGNLIRTEALVSGQTITGSSADIEITSDGTIGDASFTEEIRLRTSGTFTFGGDPGSASGYQLDNDELTRVHSGGDLFITADGSEGPGQGPIVIDTATIVAGAGAAPGDGTFGDGGTLTFLGGPVDVLGDLTIESATADTTLLFDSIRTRIDTASGGIFMFDDNGALSGQLNVLANDFYAVTDDALADIQNLDTAGVDQRLADSDGVDRPDGVIRVGALDITTRTSDVFVQNTALGSEFEERRGIEVNSLFISDPSGTDPQPIVINGIINGQVGIDAIPEAVIDSSFDSASTINGCQIANPAACGVDPTGSSDSSIAEGLQDLIEEEIRDESEAEEGVADGTFDTPLIEINELDDPSSQPLIDDPVTGAGNEDLWEAPLDDCDPAEAGEACPG